MENITNNLKDLLLRNKMAQIALLLFVFITIWWLRVDPFNSEIMVNTKHLWSSTYELLSIFGGICGIIISKYWGGYKSLIGKAIICFSIGLLLQSFGQTMYNYFTLVNKIEAPYPSWGDLGYFGSIPAYILGVIMLGRVVGLKFSFRSISNQILAILLPLLMLIISYFLFLKGYEFDWSNKLKIFLDFGYPMGQAIYVSLAILVLLVSRKLLGGIMKKPVLLLLFALIVQYVCDFNFLYQANNGNWYAGGWGDYLYAVSYFIMILAILSIGVAFNKIKNS